MKIIEKKLSEIKPYENNPRNNDDAVWAVANSIKEFGFKQPIVVDKDGVIVAGHTRYKAAEELGLETVPCVVADDLTEEQVRAFRIADNKTAELATWKDTELRFELSNIPELDMTAFGFGDFELTMLMDDLEPEPFDKDVETRYSGREQDYLSKKRVIINYTDETEGMLKELLGLENIDRVVYDVEEFA